MKKLLSLALALLMVIGLLPAMAEGNVYTSLYSSEITTLNYLTTTVTNNFSLACNLVDTLVGKMHYSRSHLYRKLQKALDQLLDLYNSTCRQTGSYKAERLIKELRPFMPEGSLS